MEIRTAIRALIERRDLTTDDMTGVMRTIMTGGATPAQVGGFLVGLRMKGETPAEIAAAARVMRELAKTVSVDKTHLIDTCGTGGDALGTFNVSTASAFVAAAAGARVAKHGNRSVSSGCGSADVLECAGIKLDLTPAQVGRCIEEIGIGFLFAPLHHQAMQHAVAPRKELATRTVFNLLGPLTNPAGAPSQLVGVFGERWLTPIAETLRQLGSQHVMVVCAEDGLDEISTGAATRVAELSNGEISRYTISPGDFGLPVTDVATLRVSSPAESLAVMRCALGGESGAAADIVSMNAGAALYVAGLAGDLVAGVARARAVLDDGAGLARVDALAKLSQSFV